MFRFGICVYLVLFGSYLGILVYGDVIICEGQSAYISCSYPRERLAIYSAVYGRTRTGVCPDINIHTTSCASYAAYQIVSRECHGKRKCLLRAHNDVFGEPCHGTNKYLEVVYACE